MQKIWTFLSEFFTNQDAHNFNAELLIAVLVVLFTALGVCIIISKKNQLYSKPKQKLEVVEMNPKNEVA